MRQRDYARTGHVFFGGVAHLARASALHAEGSEFDAHHFHYNRLLGFRPELETVHNFYSP